MSRIRKVLLSMAGLIAPLAVGVAPGTAGAAAAPLNSAYVEVFSGGNLSATSQFDIQSADQSNGQISLQGTNGNSNQQMSLFITPPGSQTLAAGSEYDTDSGTTMAISVPGTPGCSAGNNNSSVFIDQATYDDAGQPTSLGIEFDVDCTFSGRDLEYVGTAAFDLTPTTPGQGYYIYESDGTLSAFGNDSYLNYLGDLSTTNLNQPIVGMATTADGAGYWMVATDGGIFAFGDAAFHGSTGALRLNKPIVGMAATPDGGGYWLVASDGGIFAFGDAPFYGSTGGIHLNQPIVGMTPTADGKGYWLVASDGGIFSFGDAAFHGSTGALHLNQPIVGMAATPDGGGYWMVASDGGIFSFGDAPFYGSTGALQLNQPIVGMTPTPDGGGYTFTAADGGVFNFGDARFYGSLGGLGLDDIVGITH
ncbi:MAG TPA: hypothetical protein VG298_04870 [Acidimicrobiales bacterium]|jgi:hypothetical protein|nr:hypothetical protein [Acidimicrobiales bacterium]